MKEYLVLCRYEPYLEVLLEATPLRTGVTFNRSANRWPSCSVPLFKVEITKAINLFGF
jgi:hypothetical protein